MRKDTPACSSYRVRAVESTYPAEPQPLRPGCERMSPRYQSFEMGLPPFRGAVRQIILFSTAVYIVLLLMMAFVPDLGRAAFAWGTLQPDNVLHGWVWQLVTYPFMYLDPIAFLLLTHFSLQLCVILLGLGAGYLWYMLFLRRGVSINFSERIYGLRNSYYRWKRRRAAKKFQVYMRKHDRTVYFDEYGNYKPPDDKRDDERGDWVN